MSVGPTVEDWFRKEVVVDEEKCMLEIMDTASPDTFGPMLRMPPNTDGFLLVFSVNCISSFEDIKILLSRLMTENKPIVCESHTE